jgi:hypothetical protein
MNHHNTGFIYSIIAKVIRRKDRAAAHRLHGQEKVQQRQELNRAQ